LLLSVNGKRILVDPMLSDIGTMPPVPLTANRLRNPTIPLPMSVADLIDGTDAVLVTHYHFDHFDEAAARSLPRDMPIFCQPGDERKLKKKGFLRVEAIDDRVEWGELTIRSFPAHHAEGLLLNTILGKSSSYFIRAETESIFVTGDAVFDRSLERSIGEASPRLIVANFGSARFIVGKPITLAADSLEKIVRLAPGAKIIAVHMDAINHCGLSKDALRKSLEGTAFSGAVAVPDEGETVAFPCA
jgi:L-ascorbate metabolism protein UlaG (beta-lactamase superfamily)